MTRPHLSDAEIQLYATAPESCEDHILTHMVSCKTCRDTANFYRQLFTDIGNIPEPAFDFDLADKVLSRLPQPHKPRTVPLIVAVIIVSIGIPILLFKNYFLKIYPGTLSASIYLFAVPILAIIGLQVYEMVKKYRNQLDLLTYS